MGLFGKKKPDDPLKAGQGGQGTAFIGAGLTVKGKVSGNGNLIMMGRLEGEFDLGGELVISPPAVVTGEVKAVTLSVSGTVEGSLTARERIHLEKNARVQGTLTTPRLAVEDGALFNGEVRMTAGPESAAKTKRAELKKAPAGKDEP